MVTPTISVLLPARNAEEHLEAALRSVLEQRFGDFELIAVDDGSTDRTGALLEEAARQDARVRVLRGPGQGLVAALNLGLSACRAPYVARMDADDVSLPTRFARELELLVSRGELAAVGCQVDIFPHDSRTEGLARYEAWLNGLVDSDTIERECLVESPLVHPAALIRADALRQVGGWRAEGWPEDYALWLALLRGGWRLANVPEVLLRWRDSPQRLTRTHSDYAMASHVRLKAFHLAQGPLASGRCILWGAGKTGRAFFRALGVHGVRVEQFVDIDPRKIGRVLHGAPVISPDQLGGYQGIHLVAAVGAGGARALIREHLRGKGWVELSQFSCVG